MLLTGWLSCVRTRWNRRGTRRVRREGHGNRVTSVRPRPSAECLEDRALLATFTVSFLGDELDGNTAAGDLSLREAIREANASPGADEIVLPAGTFNLSLVGADEDSAATGDLDITDDLTITGAGAGSTTIQGNGIDRVFHVHAGVTANFANVRITGGLAEKGGGLRIESNFETETQVTITSSRLDHNQAIGSEGTSGEGGAIYVSGELYSESATVVIEDSDLDHNTAQGGLGRVSGSGGAIFNNSGIVEIHESRLSNNLAQSGAGENIGSGGAAKGGAISNRFGHVEIFESELTDNVARGGADGDGAAEGGLSIRPSSSAAKSKGAESARRH